MFRSSNQATNLEQDSLKESQELIFSSIDTASAWLEKQMRFAFHFLLHLFVIVLGMVSDLFDGLYSWSRDLFLKTATRERDMVAQFWPHLKEYKKEKEEDQK